MRHKPTSLMLIAILLVAARGENAATTTDTHSIAHGETIPVELGDIPPGEHTLELTSRNGVDLDYYVTIDGELYDQSESLLPDMSTVLHDAHGKKVVVYVRNNDEKERDGAVTFELTPAAAVASLPASR